MARTTYTDYNPALVKYVLTYVFFVDPTTNRVQFATGLAHVGKVLTNPRLSAELSRLKVCPCGTVPRGTELGFFWEPYRALICAQPSADGVDDNAGANREDTQVAKPTQPTASKTGAKAPADDAKDQVALKVAKLKKKLAALDEDDEDDADQIAELEAEIAELEAADSDDDDDDDADDAPAKGKVADDDDDDDDVPASKAKAKAKPAKDDDDEEEDDDAASSDVETSDGLDPFASLPVIPVGWVNLTIVGARAATFGSEAEGYDSGVEYTLSAGPGYEPISVFLWGFLGRVDANAQNRRRNNAAMAPHRKLFGFPAGPYKRNKGDKKLIGDFGGRVGSVIRAEIKHSSKGTAFIENVKKPRVEEDDD